MLDCARHRRSWCLPLQCEVVQSLNHSMTISAPQTVLAGHIPALLHSCQTFKALPIYHTHTVIAGAHLGTISAALKTESQTEDRIRARDTRKSLGLFMRPPAGKAGCCPAELLNGEGSAYMPPVC